MICPTCAQEIPDKLPDRKHGPPPLLCPRCIAAQSYRVMLDFQRGLILHHGRGDYLVTLTRSGEMREWHIAMAQYAQLFCGLERKKWKQKKRAAYSELTGWKICPRCREVFEGILNDLASEVR